MAETDALQKKGEDPAQPASPSPVAQKLYALVIDDEPANRDFLMRLLQQAKFEVRGGFTARMALEAADELGDQIKLVMIDHVLPDRKGTDLLETLRQKLPHAKLVMATMHDEPSMIHEAFTAGCAAFLVKPHGFMELFRRVQNVANDIACLDSLEGLVFDQYGPRPWRSGEKRRP